jgi:hypothetical protein
VWQFPGKLGAIAHRIMRQGEEKYMLERNLIEESSNGD